VTEQLVAHVARKRLFPRVRPAVLLQGRPDGKCLLAKGALEGFLPCVHSLVIFEGRGIRKVLSAVAASVGFLARVNSHMFLQVHTRAEAFITGVTLVRLFPRVHPSVLVAVVLPVEPLSAHRAFEGLLDDVNH